MLRMVICVMSCSTNDNRPTSHIITVPDNDLFKHHAGIFKKVIRILLLIRVILFRSFEKQEQ